ncbi:MAG: hypothetical protein HQK76_20030 [Desulfobacterales bacterium]|nr:hypothetical protein [Desulfobacterales bacterium]
MDVLIKEDHVQVMKENPFVNDGNYDFSLKRATSPGMVLPSPFNEDYNGRIRGKGGTWDRGAYEYSL